MSSLDGSDMMWYRKPAAIAPTRTSLSSASSVLGHMAVAFVLVGATAIGLTGPAGAAITTSDPWPSNDFNAAHSRVNGQETTLTASTVASARLLTSANPYAGPSSGGCDEGDVPLAPIEANGYLYTVVNSVIVKVNAATGTVVWRSALDLGIGQVFGDLAVSHGLVIAGGSICFGSSDFGTVQAVSAQTGAKVWESQEAVTAMVVSGSDVVIGTRATQSTAGDVVVRDVATGALRWRAGSADCSEPAVVVGGNVIGYYCVNLDFRLVAWSLATGTEQWSRPITWRVLAGDTPAAVSTAAVYLRSPAGALVAVNAQTGTTRATLPPGAEELLAVGPSRTYTSCQNGLAICAYPRSPDVRFWSHRFSNPYNNFRITAAVGGGVVYLNNGEVLSAVTGTRITTLWTEIVPSLLVSDGRVIVTTVNQFGRWRVHFYGLPTSG